MELYIFDLDGTLLNTLPTIAYYGNLALSENGFSEYDTEEYKYFIGDGRDILIHRMLEKQNADSPENFTKVAKTYDNAYEADGLYLTEPYKNINETLTALKKDGKKLAVLSNKPDNVANAVVEKMLPDIFDMVWGKKTDFPVKPDPTSVLKMLELFGINKKDAVFIGDTDVDIKTGKNAGLKTVGCEWGFRGKEELLSAGCDLLAVDAMDILKV